VQRFIGKILIFSIFPLITLYGVFLLENGTADPFYQRFTTPKQEALILGNSKAAQGIIPSILNEELKGFYDGKLYNYSFTVYDSPYGPAYLESIKKKLANSESKNCFILTVDPWSIASDINDPNNPDKFEENKRFISSIKNVNVKPNLNYLLNCFDLAFIEIIIFSYKNRHFSLEKDGWFKVNGDKNNYKKNKEKKVLFYEAYLQKYSHSEIRLNYLKKTIQILKSRGDVFLVRMPIHQDLLALDNRLNPIFTQIINDLSYEFSIPYFDFMEFNCNYEFKDGIHLTIESAIELSLELADKIKVSSEQSNANP
jgi:hypothetical protein